MISVCIATYNGEKYIKEQIDSILPQLGNNDEVIISDDGSGDNTVDICHRYQDRRIRIIKGPKMHSPIRNFECALQKAKGDYIFLADQDDVWNEKKIGIMMQYLKTFDCVVSDCITIDSEKKLLSDSFYAINHTKKGKLYNLFIKSGYLGCCMAFNRKILQKALPFPKDTPMHDIWIGNVAAFFYNLCFIPDKLILFRRHGNNATTTATESKYSLMQKIGFRIAICKGLIQSSIPWR